MTREDTRFVNNFQCTSKQAHASPICRSTRYPRRFFVSSVPFVCTVFRHDSKQSSSSSHLSLFFVLFWPLALWRKSAANVPQRRSKTLRKSWSSTVIRDTDCSPLGDAYTEHRYMNSQTSAIQPIPIETILEQIAEQTTEYVIALLVSLEL